jgi:hypothetical protein
LKEELGRCLPQTIAFEPAHVIELDQRSQLGDAIASHLSNLIVSQILQKVVVEPGHYIRFCMDPGANPASGPCLGAGI